MNLKLRTTSYRALDGTTYQEAISIQRETPRAILVRIEKRGKAREMWLPKSQIRVTQDRILVPDWLWEEHESNRRP